MKRTIIAVLLLLAVGLPCCAQQPSVEQLKATAVSLTAESAKRGENANFQACGTDNKYALCITFPGVDASDFAEKTYTNLNFAKEMAGQGIAAVLIRNTTTDKALSQNYEMNVTEEGWTPNDKYIHDAAENIAVMLAENQHDPTKKVIALRTFIQSYPKSVVKKAILERLMDAQSQAGDKEGSVATAKQLLAAGGTSDTARVHALWVIVYLRMAEAKAGTNTDQYLKEAKEYSEIGMQALEQVSKPEYMSEEQLATFKSNSTAAFKDAISTEDAHSAAEKTVVPVAAQTPVAPMARPHKPAQPPTNDCGPHISVESCTSMRARQAREHLDYAVKEARDKAMYDKEVQEKEARDKAEQDRIAALPVAAPIDYKAIEATRAKEQEKQDAIEAVSTKEAEQKARVKGGVLVEIHDVGSEYTAESEAISGGKFLVIEVQEVVGKEDMATGKTHLIACLIADTDSCGLQSPGLSDARTRFILRTGVKAPRPENTTVGTAFWSDGEVVIRSGSGIEMTGPVQVRAEENDAERHWVTSTDKEGTNKFFTLSAKTKRLLFPPDHDSNRCTIRLMNLGITPVSYCTGTPVYGWETMTGFPR